MIKAGILSVGKKQQAAGVESTVTNLRFERVSVPVKFCEVEECVHVRVRVRVHGGTAPGQAAVSRCQCK